VNPRVAPADPQGDLVDRCPVADVADLGLASDLVRDGLQPLAPPREEDAAERALGEGPRESCADPARPPGDDGNTDREG
jgi:hypothetical protein